MYPDSVYTDPVMQTNRYPFKFSRNWFTRFQRRYRISLRAKTNVSQYTPETYEKDILFFHIYVRKSSELQPSDVQLSNTDLPVGRFHPETLIKH